MELYPNHYFHIYNRSNNFEIVFKEPENYRYFLEKYQRYCGGYFNTLAYCLMPTHFHLLVQVKSVEIEKIKKNFGLLLSSYAKAVNKRYQRHGSLFQQHTKTKHIDDEAYLIRLLAYIHRNPIRAGFVNKPEDWEFSSYRDYIGLRKPDSGIVRFKNGLHLVKNYFSTMEEFKEFSKRLIDL